MKLIVATAGRQSSLPFVRQVGVGQNGFQFGQNVLRVRPTWRENLEKRLLDAPSLEQKLRGMNPTRKQFSVKLRSVNKAISHQFCSGNDNFGIFHPVTEKSKFNRHS